MLAKRCLCSIASSAVGTTLSVGGMALGAAIGTTILPGVGTVIGAFLGLVVGIFASLASNKGIDAIGDMIVSDEKELKVLKAE